MDERSSIPKPKSGNKTSNRGHGHLDVNQTAYAVFQQAIGEIPKPDPDAGKNPAAVTLGRLGGLKGGKARAERLTPEQRAEIAKNAAAKRWGKG